MAEEESNLNIGMKLQSVSVSSGLIQHMIVSHLESVN